MVQAALRIEIEDVDVGECLVTLVGEIDIATAPLLRERFIELIERGCRSLTVDGSAVRFIDSTGIGVLVGCRSRLRSDGGTLSVVRPSDRFRRACEVAGVARWLFPNEPLESV
jgi:anti-sigma B factor antagonist